MQANIVGVCTLHKSAFNSDPFNLEPVARQAGIPVLISPKLNDKDTVNWISKRRPDVIFCLGWF